MDIAVIGSGISGLTTAYLCKNSGYNVTIFEREPKLGMDAHRVDLTNGEGFIDVPLRVMTPVGWKTVLKLADYLKVETFSIDVGLSYSWENGETWLSIPRVMRGSHMLPIPSSLKYITRKNIGYLREIKRLKKILNENTSWPLSYRLDQFFQDHYFKSDFVDYVLIPVLETITTCNRSLIRGYPAKLMVDSLSHIMSNQKMVRFAHGTKDLAGRLGANMLIHYGSAVKTIENRGHRILVTNERGDKAECDHLVTAVQANHLGILSEVINGEDASLLQSLTFDRGEIVCHQDERFMPKSRKDWCVLNYQMSKNLEDDCFTVWLNPIEPSLKSHTPMFQSWNPPRDKEIHGVLMRTYLERSVVTSKSENAWTKLEDYSHDQSRRIHFTGSWTYPGVPLLESAVLSAVRAASNIGAKIPWSL